MVREYLKSVLHEIEEQRKANTAEIEEQRLEKDCENPVEKRIRYGIFFTEKERRFLKRTAGRSSEKQYDSERRTSKAGRRGAAAGKKTGKFPENAGRSGRAGEKGKKVKCFT